MSPTKWYLTAIVLLSAAAFVLYGIDKKRAKRKQWRIPEATLLLIAFLGGAPGAFLGMQIFRHKTKHLKFTLLVPLFLLLHLGAFLWLLKTAGW